MHLYSLRSITKRIIVFGILLLIAVMVMPWASPSPGWAQDTRLEQFSPREEMDRKEQIRRNSRDANAWYYLGRYYDFTHRNQQAAEAFYQATLLKPGCAEAFFNLGKMYRSIGRPREAAQALQRAILLKSNFSRAYFYLGLVLLDLDRAKEAAAAMMEAYTLSPGYFETYFDTTSYGIHSELGDKDAILKLVQIIYPENQQLAQILSL
jgi:tetratricopeptide (TPR) repeat protein